MSRTASRSRLLDEARKYADAIGEEPPKEGDVELDPEKYRVVDDENDDQESDEDEDDEDGGQGEEEDTLELSFELGERQRVTSSANQNL